ncbi:MAG: hypothetical protein ABL898_03295 [Hyphomicrobiaceae bacterium]|nr:hypothetical protein [Hyphomicrobiaceae bacterium]
MDTYLTRDGLAAAPGASDSTGVRGAPRRGMPGRTIGTEQVPALPLFDAELGQIFIRMRGITGLGVWDMARATGSDPTIIANLEAGALDGLPDWADVVRIVEAYAGLAQVESQPILSRMLQGYAQNTPTVSAPITTYLGIAPESPAPVRQSTPEADDVQEIVPYDVAQARRQATTVRPITVTAPSGRHGASPRSAAQAGRAAAVAQVVVADLDDDVSEDAVPRRRLWPIAAIIVLALVAATMLVARTAPGALYTALTPLPGAVQGSMRTGVDGFVHMMAPTREGLTWIDTGDPRGRRRDKLPEPSR